MQWTLLFQPLEDVMGGPEDKNLLMGKPPGTYLVYPWETYRGGEPETEYRFARS